MKQLICSDTASNNVPQNPDLSLGKAECMSTHANKLHFSFDEAPRIFISNPFSELQLLRALFTLFLS